MNGKQLKNSILQLAIQGKLVPQDPNDEPASELLKRIRKEKEQLVKDGKLKKKDLETTPITDEEKPFDIPESWEWCRLGDIVNKIYAGGDKPKDFMLEKSINHSFPVVGNGVTNDGIIGYTSIPTAPKGTITVAGRGTIGYTQYRDYEYCPIVRLIVLEQSSLLNYRYLMYCIRSISVESLGTSIPQLTVPMIRPYNIPLPPLAEQHRIVEKIEELMPLVDKYDKAQAELEKLNTTLPEALKKSILQEAIQGKLVPQDPNDEPASVLLEKIRKEKEQLVKDGKLKKKDLITTPVTDEEKPFDIPESWEWVNIPMIGISQLGKTKNPNQTKGKTYPYLCSINVYWDGINLDVLKEMLFDNNEIEKYSINKGDLLVCEGGDCGRAAIWTNDTPILYQNALHRIRFYGKIKVEYILNCLLLYHSTGALDEFIKGETIKHLVKGQLDSIPFPLPPLAEQHRIVEKIEELFKGINNIIKIYI